MWVKQRSWYFKRKPSIKASWHICWDLKLRNRTRMYSSPPVSCSPLERQARKPMIIQQKGRSLLYIGLTSFQIHLFMTSKTVLIHLWPRDIQTIKLKACEDGWRVLVWSKGCFADLIVLQRSWNSCSRYGQVDFAGGVKLCDGPQSDSLRRSIVCLPTLVSSFPVICSGNKGLSFCSHSWKSAFI